MRIDLAEHSRDHLKAMIERYHTHTFSVVMPPYMAGSRPILTAPNIYGRLKGTIWYVRWDDGRVETVDFTEFLAFLHTTDGVELGRSVCLDAPTHQVTVDSEINLAAMVTDAAIRKTLAKLGAPACAAAMVN